MNLERTSFGYNLLVYSCCCSDMGEDGPEPCYEAGVWSHPNYPSYVCDRHKGLIDLLLPHGWRRTKLDD